MPHKIKDKKPSWDDLWLTNRVLEQLAPYVDQDDLLHHLPDVLRELFPHDAGLVATVEDGTDPTLHIAQIYGLNGAAARLPPRVAPAELIDPWAFDAGPLYVPDLAASPLRVADLFAGNQMRSLLSIPLASREDDTVAVLLLAGRRARAFAGIGEARLASFRRAVAIPLANSQLFSRRGRRHHAMLAAATHIWDVVGSKAAAPAVLHELLDQARALVGAEAGAVLSVVPGHDAFYVRTASGLAAHLPADALVPWASRSTAPLQRMDHPHWMVYPAMNGTAAPAAGAAAPPAIARAGFRTYLAVPLHSVMGDLVGLLNLFWRSEAVTLGEQEWSLLESLARMQAAVLALDLLADRIEGCDRALGQFQNHKARVGSLIGHQLRTPITSITGYAQLLLRRAPDPTGPVARYADTILAESRRLSLLIDNVIELSRLEGALVGMEWRAFDLEALLQDMHADSALRSLVPLDSLAWDVPDHLPIAVGDPLRLKQALVALLQRAQAATPEEAGPAGFAVRPVPTPEGPALEIRIRSGETGAPATTAADLLLLIDLRTVIDNPNAQSSDLALYTALQLLGAMGADLRVEVGAGGQTCYVVTLQALAEE